MKKVLLGTSAIALAGAFTTQVQAAEWEVKVGGYMEQYVAYATSDPKRSYGIFYDSTNATFFTALEYTGNEEYDGVDSKQDAEIHFIPSITLDNGIKIGANIQLEGNTSGDQIDESYLFVKGSFGEILLGSENSAGYKMTYAAPDVTFVNVNSGSLGNFIPFSGGGRGSDVFRGTLGSTYIENMRNNDAQRITYFTPRFAGFQVGVSYARDGNQDSNAQLDTDALSYHDVFDIGANFVRSFGDFSVAVSGRWGTASAPGPDPEVWSAGINLGYAGFTVGGSYAKQRNAGAMNGHAYDAGVSYETGPWGFSFTYFHGVNKNNESYVFTAPNNPDGTFYSNEKLDQYLLGVSYALAKGVKLNAFGAYVNFKENCCGEYAEKIDGWVIGTGIKVSF